MHIRYGILPIHFYTNQATLLILFPLTTMVIAKIVLGFIKILEENKKLTKTIKNILKAFPEGMIIQSLDSDTQNLIVQFVNDGAKKDLIKYEEPLGKTVVDDRLDFIVKETKLLIGERQHDNLNANEHSPQLSELLKHH